MGDLRVIISDVEEWLSMFRRKGYTRSQFMKVDLTSPVCLHLGRCDLEYLDRWIKRKDLHAQATEAYKACLLDVAALASKESGSEIPQKVTDICCDFSKVSNVPGWNHYLLCMIAYSAVCGISAPVISKLEQPAGCAHPLMAIPLWDEEWGEWLWYLMDDEHGLAAAALQFNHIQEVMASANQSDFETYIMRGPFRELDDYVYTILKAADHWFNQLNSIQMALGGLDVVNSDQVTTQVV